MSQQGTCRVLVAGAFLLGVIPTAVAQSVSGAIAGTVGQLKRD